MLSLTAVFSRDRHRYVASVVFRSVSSAFQEMLSPEHRVPQHEASPGGCGWHFHSSGYLEQGSPNQQRLTVRQHSLRCGKFDTALVSAT